MNILVWQWGRRGAGPRFAACLAEALTERPSLTIALSLCCESEIMQGPAPPRSDLPVTTYRGFASLLWRMVTAPLALPGLARRVRHLRPDLAICAMPGPLDLLMMAALRLAGARIVVVVHEADRHLGDGFPFQMMLQRLLCRTSDRIAVLTEHVADRLKQQGLCGIAAAKLVPFTHPPFAFDMPRGARPSGPPRLLCFGRLLPYKGLDLLAAALNGLEGCLDVRIAGLGPESSALAALRTCPSVTVENRWVPETEIGALLAWSDAVILPYREASQSGVAAAALAAGRPVIATRVGGLGEQLATAPNVYLCEPDEASLRTAIEAWLEAPPDLSGGVERCQAEARDAWREASWDLIQAVSRADAGRRTRLRGSSSPIAPHPALTPPSLDPPALTPPSLAPPGRLRRRHCNPAGEPT
jgi:glycosyltransferase involved in cell wall biosynthesis